MPPHKETAKHQKEDGGGARHTDDSGRVSGKRIVDFVAVRQYS